MSDLVRYTQLSNQDNIVENVTQTINKLSISGYTIVEVDNKYLNSKKPYKAVHIQAISTNGQSFEIQFHTPESYDIKLKNHILYQEARKPGITKERKKELMQQMKNNSYVLTTPKDIAKLTSWSN